MRMGVYAYGVYVYIWVRMYVGGCAYGCICIYMGAHVYGCVCIWGWVYAFGGSVYVYGCVCICELCACILYGVVCA